MTTYVERVMGTVASITVHAGGRDDREVTAAIARACRVLHDADETFSTFRDDSAVMRHRRGEFEADEMPPELLEVLELSAAAVRLTDGAFDPWAMPGGFDPTGLVKGWAAQRALDELKGAGLPAAMVNAGGDIACFGSSPWRIGVRHPSDPERLVCVAGVESAIATSGDYERPGEIIDPQTGSAVSRLKQATVTGPALALADAHATALVVRGEEGLGLLAGSRYEAVVVTLDGRMLATAGFPIAPPSDYERPTAA
jgi:FAD:protein FMN transferase